jgi:hypothetical protein
LIQDPDKTVAAAARKTGDAGSFKNVGFSMAGASERAERR